MMNKDNRNDKIRKIAKKGLTFSLCAVLAGGLAAGSFEGVNKLGRMERSHNGRSCFK